MTLREIYDHTIKPLDARERLQLASLILNDIAPAPVDVSDEWTDEDLRDFTAAGWGHIDNALGESPNAKAG
jgi:hypothetical protein